MKNIKHAGKMKVLKNSIMNSHRPITQIQNPYTYIDMNIFWHIWIYLFIYHDPSLLNAVVYVFKNKNTHTKKRTTKKKEQKNKKTNKKKE